MPLLSVDDVSITFHSRLLLNHVSFRVNPGDRIAFIGNNGAGKSTLFRIIRGTQKPDEGNVLVHGNTIVGFLSQNMDEQDFNGKTLKPVKMTELESEIAAVQLEISTHAVNNDDENSSEYKRLMSEYTTLTAAYEAAGGYDYEYRMHDALAGLGLTGITSDRDLSTLSGGEKMRVCLAQLIVSRPDILMLDEPTNHLDIEAVEWLEKFLSSYGGAVFVISHDRRFIDAVANRVIELNNGSIMEFRGNYSDYRVQYEEYIKTEKQALANLEAELEHQLDVKQTMLSHRNISGYHAREKVVNKLTDILEKERAKLADGPMTMSFTMMPQAREGAVDKILLSCRNVSKRFDDDPMLFENINFELKANEKLFLCGPNGCGKSTLLTMLLGRQGGFDGTVFVSASAECGYMGQFVPFENEELTCLEELMSRTEFTETAARSMLARFGFRDIDVFKRIEVLSGGERSRLYLCCLLQEKPDILFLDEPTNHLDISSREVLEDALSEYNGAIICVSHDRFFIDKCADKILGFYSSTADVFDDYEHYRRFASKEKDKEKEIVVTQSDSELSEKPAVKENLGKQASINRAKERKLIAKRREQIRDLETQIFELEEQQKILENGFGADSCAQDYKIYADNAACLEELTAKYLELCEEEDS